MGFGECKSSSHEDYDNYFIGLENATPGRCANYCEKQEGFVGFHIYYGYFCHCLYEDGGLPNPCPSTTCNDTFGGVGDISLSSGSMLARCYMINQAISSPSHITASSQKHPTQSPPSPPPTQLSKSPSMLPSILQSSLSMSPLPVWSSFGPWRKSKHTSRSHLNHLQPLFPQRSPSSSPSK